jgi:hypothetical protein
MGSRKTAAASIAVLLLIVAFLQFELWEKRVLQKRTPNSCTSNNPETINP